MTTPSDAAGWTPLDLEQFRRIGAVHRGFLHQHLLTAGLVVAALEEPGSITQIRIEADEDVEIDTQVGTVYLQVKTTSDPLVFSEVVRTLVRFDHLRREHNEGRRIGLPRFGVAVAGPLGAELQAIAGGVFASDLTTKLCALAEEHRLDLGHFSETLASVRWLQPGNAVPGAPRTTLAASAMDQFASLSDRLAHMPRLANSPATAALALAASVQIVAADAYPGVVNRLLPFRQLDALVERVAITLERLPTLPEWYLPLPLRDQDRLIRLGTSALLVGPSGSGKSTHLAWEAITWPSAAVHYVRAREGAAGTTFESLVAALATSFATAGGSSAALLKARSSAVPSEDRAQALAEALPATHAVIIDNCHFLASTHAGTSMLIGALAARDDISLVLAGQPVGRDGTPTVDAVTLAAGRRPKVVDAPGWQDVDIAACFRESDIPLTPPLASAVREITGGYPVFVLGVLSIVADEFGGDAATALSALREGVARTSARSILERAFASLSAPAQRVAAALALLGFSPTWSELDEIGRDIVDASVISELAKHRLIVRRTAAGGGSYRIELHEAYESVAHEQAPVLLNGVVQRVIHERAAAVLGRSLETVFEPTRAIAFYDNLLSAGTPRAAADLLSSSGSLSAEALQRRGLGSGLARLCSQFLVRAGAAEDRYWLRDALLFLYFTGMDIGRDAAQLWSDQESEVSKWRPTPVVVASFRQKQIMWHASRGNLTRAKKAWERLRAGAPDVQRRIADYTYALALHKSGHSADALPILRTLIHQYADALGLSSLMDIYGERAVDVIETLSSGPPVHRELLVWLADCLDLAGRCLKTFPGEWPIGLFQHAHQFYNITLNPEPLLKSAFSLCELLIRHPKAAQLGVDMIEDALAAVRTRGLSHFLLETIAWASLVNAIAGNPCRAQSLLLEAELFDTSEAAHIIAATRATLSLAQSPEPPPPGFGPLTKAFMRHILDLC